MARMNRPCAVILRLLWLVMFWAAIGLHGSTARGLIMVGIGNRPVTDMNWPLGSLAVANLSTRVGYWEGPPFGGGQWEFLYRGDAAAAQEALDAFAAIRAPSLRLVIQEGRQENAMLKTDTHNVIPKEDTYVDWTFTVWDPRSFYQLYANPNSISFGDSGSFRNPVDPPIFHLFVAGPDAEGIDMTKIHVPKGLEVIDERAIANGYKAEDLNVVCGDVYDMLTSKPVSGAAITVMKRVDKGTQKVIEGQADADGHFEIKRIPAGSLSIQIGAKGYVDRTVDAATFGGHVFRKYTVQLAPPAVVSGVVRDTAGKPVPGAKVRAEAVLGPDGRGYPMVHAAEAIADAKGQFEVTGVPQGWLQLWPSAPTFQVINLTRIFQAPTKDVTLTLTATGNIKGAVVKADGTPVTSGTVSVTAVKGESSAWGGGTSIKPDGTFEFTNASPGRYTISTNPMNIMGQDPTAQVIEVKIGQTVNVVLKDESRGNPPPANSGRQSVPAGLP